MGRPQGSTFAHLDDVTDTYASLEALCESSRVGRLCVFVGGGAFDCLRISSLSQEIMI